MFIFIIMKIYKHLSETKICPQCNNTIDMSSNDDFYHNCTRNSSYFDSINVDSTRYEISLKNEIILVSDIESSFTSVYKFENNSYDTLVSIDSFIDLDFPFIENANLVVDKLLKMKLLQ